MAAAPVLRLRRDIEQLSMDELGNLREAFRQIMQLKDDRGYAHHAGIYGLPLPISSLHSTPLFLPWHRAWLYYFEEALRDRVPGVTLPWWDWTTGPGRPGGIPSAFTDPEDAVNGGENPLRSGQIPSIASEKDTPRPTQRVPAKPGAPPLPHVDAVRKILTIAEYENFAAQLEDLHNGVHVWVGGDLASIGFAAYDPLNWSLSVMVDQIWHAWQLLHPDPALPADFADRALPPFPISVRQTLDIKELGYDYPPLRLRGAGPSLARYDSDLVDPSMPVADLLGVSPEVDALAALITQREVQPPLAVGLFGDWGSGKSFFMRLLRQRVDELTTASRAADADASAFCSEVSQITYNAWHYADADLWSSLVGESLRRLAEMHPDLKLPFGLASMRDRRTQLDQRVAETGFELQAAEKARAELRAEREARGPAAFARRFAGGRFFGLPAYLRDHPLTLGLIVLGTLLLFVGLVVVGDDLDRLITTIGGVITLVGGLLRPLRDIESKEQAADRRLAEAAAADIAAHDELSQLYRDPVGLAAALRQDLAGLSALLEQESSPIDRVVLYIDDLDRCSAERVVAVLEAIHVLLAFKLFVVVVGVDSRWLLSSLRNVYKAQFDAGSTTHASWVTTPQNYLEKIFQIPYAVPAMQAGGFRRFVEQTLAADLVRDGGGDDLATANPEGGALLKPDDNDGQATDYAIRAASTVHLRPPSLKISRDEVAFIARLGKLVSSPRAGKRLINTYRLLRAPLGELELASFEGPAGEYRVVASLLAVMTGVPAAAPRVFGAILAEADTTGWSEFSQRLRAATPTDVDAGDWARVIESLDMLDEVFGTDTTMELFKRWVPRVSRYSFETSRLMARSLGEV